MLQTLQNTLDALRQNNGIGLAILFGCAILLAALSSFRAIRESGAELEAWGDIPALPGLSTRRASTEAGCDDHVAGDPNSVVVGEQ